MKKKILVPVVAMSMMVSAMVGGTLAFLADKTEQVENTFTVGNVDIELTETTGDTYKMVPGVTMAKDPTVTVVGDSENCWLFVEVDKSANFDKYLECEIAPGWTKLEDGVYYMLVGSTKNDLHFPVLENSIVTTKTDVTKDMMDDIVEGTEKMPTLTFKAYAVQEAGFDTAADAWVEAKK